VPGAVELVVPMVRVEVPEPVTDVGLRVAVIPAGVVAAVSDTVPLKPPSELTVTVLVPDAP